MHLDLILGGKQRPGLVEALALIPPARCEDRLRAMPPAHPAEFEALRDKRLARSLDEARADHQAVRATLRVAHPVAILAKVRSASPDLVAARKLFAQVIERANDLADPTDLITQDGVELLAAMARPQRAITVGGGERAVEMLGGVEEVEDLFSLRELVREVGPVVLGAVGDLHDAQARLL
ncbi:MAG: hypothetical protein NT062_37000, partial [Proteobacteria bacterium]|nr:hypothetical protein [Pseudomonadota bacterium]